MLSKLKLRRPSIYNPDKLILEFDYMANGLTFEILNIILPNFTHVRILIEN